MNNFFNALKDFWEVCIGGTALAGFMYLAKKDRTNIDKAIEDVEENTNDAIKKKVNTSSCKQQHAKLLYHIKQQQRDIERILEGIKQNSRDIEELKKSINKITLSNHRELTLVKENLYSDRLQYEKRLTTLEERQTKKRRN